VHGQRRSVSPRSHWDDVLNVEPNRKKLILNRLGSGCKRDAFDNHPHGLESLCLNKVNGTLCCFRKVCMLM
jgi:hypothetical protein